MIFKILALPMLSSGDYPSMTENVLDDPNFNGTQFIANAWEGVTPAMWSSNPNNTEGYGKQPDDYCPDCFSPDSYSQM
eukprot:CAMPEP_0206234958 /NCGR_PEP_ID=MMETSP0047_2-20121206/12881_1 /ASSEMBLY_ACC=CAM_ASM_000192 /TAXON_ID=195065 /ORGANISM="Chroomonas mesostigmatica_cf, Strain CCMP1168" /LENGTH=77 /DNA_ID=CAMNT_0053659105 /DNA_START=14 /DNA_END=247 /DNA_ORIENTATION=+